MAMNIKYDGTTWAVSEAQRPNYLERSLEQAGGDRRTWLGTQRRYNRYSKWVQPLAWSDVEDAVRTHVSAIAQLAGTGTVTVEYATGTFTFKPVDQSYSEKETSWASYNLGITLKEV